MTYNEEEMQEILTALGEAYTRAFRSKNGEERERRVRVLKKLYFSFPIDFEGEWVLEKKDA